VPEGLALPAPAQPAAAGVIEIELASGARLRITGAVEPATVSAVIASLAGARR
jgi:transposase